MKIRCHKCRRGAPAKPLPISRVTQGQYGNCAACYRHMVKV